MTDRLPHFTPEQHAVVEAIRALLSHGLHTGTPMAKEELADIVNENTRLMVDAISATLGTSIAWIHAMFHMPLTGDVLGDRIVQLCGEIVASVAENKANVMGVYEEMNGQKETKQ